MFATRRSQRPKRAPEPFAGEGSEQERLRDVSIKLERKAGRAQAVRAKAERTQAAAEEADRDYEVERVTAEHEEADGTLWYHVKWAGYTAAHAMWVPAGDMVYARGRVENFKMLQGPSAPAPPAKP